MDRLEVDVDQLEALSGRLTRSINTLNSDDFFSQVVADLVGHPGLADKVRTFSTGWNDNRRVLLERLTGVRDSVQKIGSSFADLETELESSIARPPTVGAPSSQRSTTSRDRGIA